jgi:hypothetical protein
MLDAIRVSFFRDLDLWIAGAVLLGGLLVYILAQIGVLPKKSIPIVIGAVAGALGLTLLSRARSKALNDRLAQLQDEHDKQDKILKDLREKNKISSQEHAAAMAKLNQQLAATRKEILLLNEKNTARKQEIEQMTPDQAFSEFNKIFGNPPAAPAPLPKPGE